MKNTMLILLLFIPFVSFAAKDLKDGNHSEKNSYIEKYRRILSDFSTDISGDTNPNTVVYEAITTSSSSGILRFNNVLLFGDKWDFSEHVFEKNKITSSSLVKVFSDDRLMKISFENVSNKIYKRFGSLPRQKGDECLSSVDGGGKRCYRVFDLPEKDYSVELSIYNKKMVLSLNGDGNDKS